MLLATKLREQHLQRKERLQNVRGWQEGVSRNRIGEFPLVFVVVVVLKFLSLF